MSTPNYYKNNYHSRKWFAEFGYTYTNSIGNIYEPLCNPNKFNCTINYFQMVFPAKTIHNWIESISKHLMLRASYQLKKQIGASLNLLLW